MEIPMMSVPWMGAAPIAKPTIEPSAKPKIDVRTENAPKTEKIEGVTGPEQKPRPNKPDFDSSSSTVRSTLPKALKIDEAALAKSASADEAGNIDLSALKVDASENADAAVVAAEFFLPVPVTLVPTPAALQPNVELASMGVADVAEFQTKAAMSAEFATSGTGPVRQAPIPVSFEASEADVFAPANDLATPEELAWAFAPANDLETSADIAGFAVPANDLASEKELSVSLPPKDASPDDVALPFAPANDLETSAEFAPVAIPANDMATLEELAPANDLEDPDVIAKLASVPANDMAALEELVPANDLEDPANIGKVVQSPANDLATDEELKQAQAFYDAQEAEALAIKTKLNYVAPQPSAETNGDVLSADVATPVKPNTLQPATADVANEPVKQESKEKSRDADLLSKAPFYPANVASSVKNDAVKQVFAMSAAPAETVSGLPEDGTDASIAAVDKAEPGFVMHVDSKAPIAPNQVASKDRSLNAVETASVLKQVSDRLEMLAAAKPKGGVTIQLDPGDLGQIILKVKGTGNDVAAEITAQHDGVRQALEANKQQLTQNLESKGLNLNQVTINTSADAKQGFDDAQTRQQNQAQSNTNNRLGFGNESTGVVWGADQIRNYSRRATGVDFFA